MDNKISVILSDVLEAMDKIAIEELGLSVRAFNCLRRAGIHTVGDIVKRSDDYLRENVRNLGEKCLDEVNGKIDFMCHRLVRFVEGVYQDKEPSENLRESPSVPVPREVDRQSVLKDAEAELYGMIGLSGVKDSVRRILDYFIATRRFPKPGAACVRPSLHMMFTGNPGTGKTTVARIIAKILCFSGVLANDTVLEVGRGDLVAEYVGQTAVKVQTAFMAARGGVLFIDEAYSLNEHWPGSYGDEAIATIVQEMENHRDDTVVIFAGYREKMKDLLAVNEGLASRINYHIDFPDYSASELEELITHTARQHGYVIAKSAAAEVHSLAARMADSVLPGNARWVRNAIESASMNWASRIVKKDESAVTQRERTTLTAEDFRHAAKSILIDAEKDHAPIIGFKPTHCQ